MKITINDQTFETPFTMRGDALALLTLRKQIRETRDLNSVSVIFVHGTDEELVSLKEKEERDFEDRIIARAQEISAKRAEAAR